MNNYIDLSQYRKIDEIGSGSFGQVFSVQKIATGEIFAAKVSHNPIDSISDSVIRDLVREVNIIAKIHHFGVLSFVGYSPTDFEKKRRPVIVTEMLRNGSLRDMIKLEKLHNHPPEWNSTKKLINIFGIASTMNFMHKHKIIHRDLKAENILLSAILTPKIADFGLSKMISFGEEDTMNMQSMSQIKGTPVYLAPEILTNNEYSEASDVYAFAFIVYEIMTTISPGQQNKNLNVYQLIQKIVNSNYRPKFVTPIPPAYEHLIRDCWAEKVQDRPTFEQIVERLKTDEGFRTNDINSISFFNYVHYMETFRPDFDDKFRIIRRKDFSENNDKEFKEVAVNYEPIRMKPEGERAPFEDLAVSPPPSGNIPDESENPPHYPFEPRRHFPGQFDPSWQLRRSTQPIRPQVKPTPSLPPVFMEMIKEQQRKASDPFKSSEPKSVHSEDSTPVLQHKTKIAKMRVKSATNNPDSTVDTHIREIKLVAVGDLIAKKTQMMLAFLEDAFPHSPVPDGLLAHSVIMTVDNHCVNLQMWDTSGQEEYPKLLPRSYPNTDVFLLMFSLLSPSSLDNVESIWISSINQFRKPIPVILVGTELSKRNNFAVHEKEYLQNGWKAVSTKQAEEMKRKIEAVDYIECDALNHINLNLVFESAIRAAFNKPPPKKAERKECIIF